MILYRKLFSRDKKKSKKEDYKAALATGALGLGAIGTGGVLSTSTYKKLGKNLPKEIARDEGNKLFMKMVKHSNDSGTLVVPGPKSLYRLSDPELKKRLLDAGVPPEMANKKSFITIANGQEAPSVISHELGHRKFIEGKYKNLKGIEKLEKAAHSPMLRIAATSPVFSGGAGAVLGYRSVKKDKETGKVSVNKKDVLKSLGAAALITAPLLVAEGAASRHGYKMLKANGATKEQLKAAGKSLKGAWGTYGYTYGLGNLGSAAVGHSLGTMAGLVAKKGGKKQEKNE